MNLKKATFINFLSKYSVVFISLFVNAVLARILTAEDYGVVAVVTVFSTFFSLLADNGFGTAIVQNKDLSKEDVNNIYSFTVYISIGFAIVFALASIPISIFYNSKVYIPLTLMLSVSLFFNSLNSVPSSILNRDKKFSLIAIRTVVIYTICAIITIILAKNSLKYYALAIQSILTALITYLVNMHFVNVKFSFRINFSSIKKVLNYSLYQFAFNIVNYFSRNLDNLLTGKFFGEAELGYYNKAYDLMLYPVNNLTGVISPVLHPILSDYQNEKDVIYKMYLKIVKLLLIIAIIASTGCYLASKEIIHILYGSNWDNSIECFKILSIAIIPQMINSSAGPIFLSIGDSKLKFINATINTIITIIAILIGIFIGGDIISLAKCVACAYILHFITAFYMLIKIGFGYKITDFIKDIKLEIVMLIVMIVADLLYPFSINSDVLSFLAKGAYLGLIHLILLIITKEYKFLIDLIKK